jgi:hypothetical protein
MFGVVPTLRTVDIEVSGFEVDLVPPQRHEFGGAQPVMEHHENDRGIPHGMPSDFARRLDHGLHFLRPQIVAYGGAPFLLPGQPHDTLPLAALSPQERTRALERYRMLQPCVEHDVPLTHVARHHGMPLRTAQRWLARYRRDAFAGLARRERRDRGIHTDCPPNSPR